MKRVVVIGGGAAGMMAAISAAEAGADVTLIEKNEKLGKKIYITGKGRCNLTNSCPVDDFFDNISGNGKFLYSAVRSFDNEDLCAFFKENGLALKTERGGRVFPVSDKSSDVIKVLKKCVEDAGVKIVLDAEVKEIFKGKDGSPHKGDKELTFNSVIVATGGLSYPSTGSTGDGYVFAKNLGHKIIEPIPSLVPIDVKEEYVKELEGLSLKNVSAKIKDMSNGKTVFDEFGEMLFTDSGVSGPIILKASSVCGRLIHENSFDASNDRLKLIIDLKPALSQKQLDARILRDFSENKNKEIKNVLKKLLPQKMVPVIMQISGIEPGEKINHISKAQRSKLLENIKESTFTIKALSGFDRAVITKGGIDVKSIDPKTMESRLAKNIFFAGEVLDVDAFTGGFNLQTAFSTGRAAGFAAAKEEYEADSDRWTCRCREKHNS